MVTFILYRVQKRMEAVTDNMVNGPECKIPEGDDTRRRSAL